MHLPLVKEYEEGINVTLKCLRHSYFNNAVFSYLNINSIKVCEIAHGIIGVYSPSPKISGPSLNSGPPLISELQVPP